MDMSPQHLSTYVAEARAADLDRRATLTRQAAGYWPTPRPERSGVRRRLVVVARLARAMR